MHILLWTIKFFGLGTEAAERWADERKRSNI